MKFSYYWIVSEILELRKYAEVWPSLTQQLVAFLKNLFLFLRQRQYYFFAKFFPICKPPWHIIIINILICNCTAESVK